MSKKRGQIWIETKNISARFLAQLIYVKNRKAQIWIETVIYTLIAFVMIGLVLSFVKPKIEEIRDKAIIEQTIEMMNYINSRILSVVQGGPGNKRIDDLSIKKGVLKIDGVNDKLVFEIESRYTYSQPGEDGAPGPEVNIGNIVAQTQKKGKLNIVTLTSDYSEEYNITYQGNDESKPITKSSTLYKLSISNEGESDDKIIINMEIK